MITFLTTSGTVGYISVYLSEIVRGQMLYSTSCPFESVPVHPGIIHFISNTDQLGQFMNRPLVGLGGKYLTVLHFID